MTPSEPSKGVDMGGRAVSSEFEVSDGHCGWRLDRIVSASIPDMSRSLARRLVEGGSVAVDGIVVEAPATRPPAGSVVNVDFQPSEPPLAFPASEDIPLDVHIQGDILRCREGQGRLARLKIHIDHRSRGGTGGRCLNNNPVHSDGAAFHEASGKRARHIRDGCRDNTIQPPSAMPVGNFELGAHGAPPHIDTL